MRLDQALAHRGIVSSRSQAESYIKLSLVKVNDKIVNKASMIVYDGDKLELFAMDQYVSRAGLKLASVSQALNLDFVDKIVLDVGSSTGGFTDYALRHGASKILAVDVGTNQLHPSLRSNPLVELHEQTDIRDFRTGDSIDIVVIDVSFISLKLILPSILKLIDKNSLVVAMFKPQFEADAKLKNKGIIKNAKIRRDLIKDFENWLRNNHLYIIKSIDSSVSGAKGNLERFFLLKKI
jgi:23S rRNA (cytidine1920-2'-O)/16S rRNA (cytidine1409-2'-O)-methyltransferase